MDKLYGKIQMQRLTGLLNVVPNTEPATYIFITEDGIEIPAVFVEDEVILTAGAGDIREGMVAATADGITVGTMVPAVGGNLQKKTVRPSESTQVVTADEGFDGLSVVNVEGAPLQEKSAALTTEPQVITADAGFYGLASVSLAAYGYPDIENITMEQEGTTVTITASMAEGESVTAILELDTTDTPVSLTIGEDTFDLTMGVTNG